MTGHSLYVQNLAIWGSDSLLQKYSSIQKIEATSQPPLWVSRKDGDIVEHTHCIVPNMFINPLHASWVVFNISAEGIMYVCIIYIIYIYSHHKLPKTNMRDLQIYIYIHTLFKCSIYRYLHV